MVEHIANLAGNKTLVLPVPAFNVINGGSHGFTVNLNFTNLVGNRTRYRQIVNYYFISHLEDFIHLKACYLFLSVGHVSKGVKPKGRGASKKALARKQKMPTAVDSEEEDDKELELKEQLTAYNIDSPSDQTERDPLCEGSPSHACNGPADASAKKAKDFLPFLQQSERLPVVVDYVLSGHRFKLLIPKETCSIPFSFSSVRCPGRDEPFLDEAIAFMRRKILLRDVEIEVKIVDRTGTFLGSLWESKTNMAVVLLESGLARLQTAFGADRIPNSHLLAKAKPSAKNQRLKIWENHVEGQEATNGSSVAETKQKEVLKVVVTEVLGGGKFYVQTVGDQKVAVI
ncbi:ribonuclease TUDOR 1-like [Magnolia sinica]|uniref:ribonuclease TUDOR 1-like n=1 Tax=Magnolia sinica TaxID=86752 RepID=UPI002659B145|nr:ribonuclease TUDOR 1-like [Magnolia sinica]